MKEGSPRGRWNSRVGYAEGAGSLRNLSWVDIHLVACLDEKGDVRLRSWEGVPGVHEAPKEDLPVVQEAPKVAPEEVQPGEVHPEAGLRCLAADNYYNYRVPGADSCRNGRRKR